MLFRSNQDYILPCVEKVAKLCADFKMGTETIYLNKENQPDVIEIDDEVRQADYKYTYSDSSQTALKSEQADMLVAAVEKFAQQIPLNLEEIFIWYFEQKGVDNPERFLAQQQQQQLDPQVLQTLMSNLLTKQQEPRIQEEQPKNESADEQNLSENIVDTKKPLEEEGQSVNTNTPTSQLFNLLKNLMQQEDK